MVSGSQRGAYKTVWTVAFLFCLADVSAPNWSLGHELRGPDSAKPEAAMDYLECTIAPPESSRVPDPLGQGEFPSPQSVSALAISPDGRQLAVTTMAFRHDDNFWLLDEDGRVLWGRYLEPWAPRQVTFLRQGKHLAAGLAYSRFTGPNPTLAMFDGESDAPIYGCDDAWELAWMHYGSGNWRTGWMASPLADMLATTEGGLFTTPFHLAGKATEKPGQWCRRPMFGRRAWRMSASADGSILVCGYFVSDSSRSQVQGVGSLESPGATLVVIDGSTGRVRWKAESISPAPKISQPPEPTDEFRWLADDFNMTPSAMVPFRAALSVAASRDAGRAACTEYGGYARIGQERIHPNWSPRHPLWLCPRQQGILRVFDAEGEELARVALPEPGLFQVHLSPDGSFAWCVPMSWFARGLAGCPWLPTDKNASRVFVFDLAHQRWSMSWIFPDAVSDFAVHPQVQTTLVSCWNGRLYLVRYDGTVQATIQVGSPARLRWSADGRFGIAGTQQGEVWRVDFDGTTAWHTSIPVRQAPPVDQPLKPVFDGIPIYRVGRVGPEHAYVGDIWLIKTPTGGILVDSGGTSGVSLTLERIKAAGVDPGQIRYLLLSHTHGDHIGGAYLWRSMGAEVVAPAPAAFPATWMVPTLNHYGIWAPCPIDQPLPLSRPGDTTHFTLDGLDIQAIFVPGHSFDSVVYILDIAGKSVFLMGDIGFQGNNHILNRCWGDVPKARRVMKILREQVLPLKPEIVITGHDEHSNGVEYWQSVIRATEEAIREAETQHKQ
ncbi:MAG: MBL fold metallo-hydrolase [Planctomycetota bacterium]|jgi:glyoxylase-like metal-dependent hydrolase (beta-lactamase superfamily II)